MIDGPAGVAIVGTAGASGPDDGRDDAEWLAPVVDAALAASGFGRADVGVVCTAGSEFLSGVVGTVMRAFDAFPGWPPRTHTHLEGDGAFALYEAWIRLLAGEADVALVCAYGRPVATNPGQVLALQLDPYLLAPLGPDVDEIAALQARALLDSGRHTQADVDAVVRARRGADTALDGPTTAPPLRAVDCATPHHGAAAVVLATRDALARAGGRPAWIAGIDQRVDTHALGARDLTESPSTRSASEQLGLVGAEVDVVEVHARYSFQELIVLDALGVEARSVNPSGGALPADPHMVTGLLRVCAAADAVSGGGARTAVAHATNGPCLQHNLVCRLESNP